MKTDYSIEHEVENWEADKIPALIIVPVIFIGLLIAAVVGMLS